MSTRRLAALPLLLALVALASTTGGASAAGWLAPVPVSSVVPNAERWDMSLQDVAVDADGDATAVWARQVADGPQRVEVATRPLGGAWGRAVVLSPAGEEAYEPRLDVGAQGDAAVVWVGVGAGGSHVVRAATRPAGGGWSAAVALSDEARFAHEPAVAVGAQGTVTALWSEGEPNSYGVIRAASRAAGGDWGASVELSDGARLAASPQVAVDPQGDVTAVWTLHTGSRDDGVIQARTRPAGGDWSATPTDLSGADGLAREPRLALDASGDATVVWQRSDIPDYSGFLMFVQAVQRTAGSWSEPVTLSRPGDFATSPELTVDEHGEATAIWLAGPLGTATRYLQTRSRSAGGTWGGAVDVVTRTGALEPQETDLQLAADGHGDVTAIWTAWQAPTLVVRSRAARAADGAPRSTSRLPAPPPGRSGLGSRSTRAGTRPSSGPAGRERSTRSARACWTRSRPTCTS